MVVCGMSFVCNARCIHCPNAATGFTATLKGPDRFMKWPTLRKLADECARYTRCLVRVSSAGEILTHPEAIEMIEYILRVKVDKNVALTTNGSLLTGDRSLRLLKAGIRAIEISADAATKGLYETIRRGLSFDMVLRNIEELVRQRDEGKFNTRIMVSVIEQEANEEHLDSIVQFWKKKVDDVLVRKLLSFKGVVPRSKRYAAYLTEDVPCPFLWERVFVDASGNVRACVSDLYNESSLGNIVDSTIAELWQSETLNRWRHFHLRGQRALVPVCKGCVDLEYRSWTYNYFAALNKKI
jgi:radical SAM protein with 4Fe4S-binding SPASM domain